MHIFISGSFRPNAIEHHYAAALRELGARVTTFGSQDLLYAHNRHPWRRLANRLHWPNAAIYASISRQVLAAVEAARPDVVWVFKGNELLPECVAELRRRGYFLANFNPDHPFHYTFRATGNANVSGAVPYYHLHFCYSRGVQRLLETRFGLSTAYLPFGHALDDSELLRPPDEPEIPRACFVGNPDRKRARLLLRLHRLGVPVDVYGDYWRRYLPPWTGIRVFAGRYGADYPPTLRRYRVQLNILRAHNAGSHNMRTFEAAAAGAIQLAEDTPEHRVFFEAGREIFLYDTADCCAYTIRTLLDLPAPEAAALRRAARRRSFDSGYHYRFRAAAAYAALQRAGLPLAGL